MDQYALYIWISYSLAFCFLFSLFYVSLRSYRSVKKQLQALA